MNESVKSIAEWCSALVETIGIGIVAGAAVYTVGYAVFLLLQHERAEVIFKSVRHSLGRAILVGLEFLVAGDIIHTVAVEMNFETLGALAIVVLIRTFLSFSLEVELTGRWPWQGTGSKAKQTEAE